MLKSWVRNWVLAFIIFGVALALRLYKIDNPIADWHSWRQTVTAAVSRDFVQNGIDPLYPRYTDISNAQTGYDNPEGYFLAEFPLFGIIHASLHSVFPNYSLDQLGRLLSAVYSSLTAVFIFLLAMRLFGNKTGLVSGLVFAVLPFSVYFGRVVLPEPLSIMLAVASLLLLIEVGIGRKNWLLYGSAALLGLAILVKPYAIFYCVPTAYILFKQDRRLFTKQQVFYALISLTPFVLWRFWISQFPEGIPHLVWAFNGDGIRFRPAWWRWLFGERLGYLMLGIWGVIPFFLGLQESLRKTKYQFFLAAFGLGLFLYLAIFATANVRHDYYQTFLLPFVAIALGLGFVKLIKGGAVGAVAAVFITIFMLGFSLYEVKGFYQINNFAAVSAGRVVDDQTPKSALVIAPYNKDMTLLYHTNRKGWPYVEKSIEDLIGKGATIYASTNFADPTTVEVLEKYTILTQTSEYLIADLTKPL